MDIDNNDNNSSTQVNGNNNDYDGNSSAQDGRQSKRLRSEPSSEIAVAVAEASGESNSLLSRLSMAGSETKLQTQVTKVNNNNNNGRASSVPAAGLMARLGRTLPFFIAFLSY